jgi:hypothetical protein
MSATTAAALEALAKALPPSDALNLSYAVLVEGDLEIRQLESAVRAAFGADPLLNRAWSWQEGSAEPEEFGSRAAQHLSTPLTLNSPTKVAIWSSKSRRYLLLMALHHVNADGIVLDRIANDISRALLGRAVVPAGHVSEREISPRRSCSATPLTLPSASPTMRASCRTVCLAPEVMKQFQDVVRNWRATPFAGALACVAAAAAALYGRADVDITIQVSGRYSSAALRASGPWYDYVNLRIPVDFGSPLRSVLLSASECLAKALDSAGGWANTREERPCAQLLVAFDRHPLSSLKIPGCHVMPLAVERHPRRNDGVSEYLVATEADIVVFFRNHFGSVGLSLFTKTATVPEHAADRFLQMMVDAIHGLREGGREALEPRESSCRYPAESTSSVFWPEPVISDAPTVDAVSPVFRVRGDVLSAFASDAFQTLNDWGTPPWHRDS